MNSGFRLGRSGLFEDDRRYSIEGRPSSARMYRVETQSLGFFNVVEAEVWLRDELG